MAMPTMAAIAKRMTGAANDSKFFSTTKKGACALLTGCWQELPRH